ncbi:MAG TPA: T9SS type A sorting domain-containing protein, partial [Saprospiraceae bacterium]|nr:T9SS type A sorting domain-containing protein [Saprospiraceae bacterium]
TTFDIVELRKLILGIYTELPNNTSWRFVEKAYTFLDPLNPFKSAFPESISLFQVPSHQFGQDFVAIKVGDVNGSATANSALSSEDRNGRTLLLDLSDREVQAGEVFDLPFKTSEAVSGFQFTLNLNGLATEEVLPSAGVSTSNFGLFPDALTVSVDGAQAFALRFRATRAGRLSDMMHMSGRITRAEAYAANERMGVALRFATPAGPVLSGMGFELYQNQPNPFEHSTRVGFYLPQATTATLTVFDETGRTLLTQRGDFAAGYQSLPISLPSGTGLLYYRLETATDSATRKMSRM